MLAFAFRVGEEDMLSESPPEHGDKFAVALDGSLPGVGCRGCPGGLSLRPWGKNRRFEGQPLRRPFDSMAATWAAEFR